MGAALPKLKIDGGDFERNTEDCLDLNALLHPAQAFSHPADVVNDPDLTLNEKRASWLHGRLMLAQLSPYRNCAALPLKEEGRSHSTMLWTHYGRWTPVRQKPAVVTTAWCASVGFSAAAAARAAVTNLSNKRGRTCGAVDL